MILTIVKQILFLFLIFFLGSGIFRLFRPKAGLAERFSSGFMLGIGFSTFGLFLLGFVGYRFDFANILIFLILGNSLLFCLNKVILKRNFDFKIFSPIKFYKSLDKLEKFFVIGTAFFLLTSLIRNLYWPVWMWDAVQLYDYRAKQIVASASIFFPAHSYYDISYPLLTSLLHAIFYTAGSTNPQFIYTFVFAAMILTVYSFTKTLAGRKLALGLSFFISFYPRFYEFSLQPISSFTSSVFVLISFFYLAKWSRVRKKRYLILVGMFLAFSRFTRTEPWWIMIIFVLLLYLLKNKELFKKRSFFTFLVIGLPSYLVGLMNAIYLGNYSFNEVGIYQSQAAFINIFFSRLGNFHLQTIVDSIVLVFSSVLLPVLVPFIVLVVLLYFLKFRLSKEESFLLYILLFFLAFFIGGAVFFRTLYSYTDFIALGGSLNRLGLFWYLLVFILLVLTLSNYFNGNNHIGERTNEKKV